MDKNKNIENQESKTDTESVGVDLQVSPNFEHGDRAVLVSDGLIYEGQIVERTYNNDFVYYKFFVMPLRSPLKIFDKNKTDMGLIFKITG